MEGVYRKVYIRMWRDDDFRELTEDGKLLFIYLLTCPHGHLSGIFPLPIGYANEDLGWENGKITAAWKDVEGKGMIRYDHKARVLLIPNFLKYNPFENKNTVICSIRNVEVLPDTFLRWEWCKAARRHLKGKQMEFVPPLIDVFMKTLGEPLAEPLGIPTRETGTEPEAGTGTGVKPLAPLPEKKLPAVEPVKVWPTDLVQVPKVLEECGFLKGPLDDPDYWAKQWAWIESTGFNINVLDEFKGYVAHQIGMAKGARHKDNRRGFRNWLATAVRWKQRDADRKGYSAPVKAAQPEGPPPERKDKCSFVGLSGKCGLRGTIGKGAHKMCPWHHYLADNGKSEGTLEEFREYHKRKVEDGDQGWAKHEAEYWYEIMHGGGAR